MNQTAKKLREEADFMSGVAVSAAETIVMARNIFGIEPTDTFGGDLGRCLETIADELDELQARAAGANNLRQRLDSAEKKAERRKKQVEHTEDAIRERNARLKMRGETIARLTAENGELRKRVPSEREREILDMWPRFEDGELVWFGDAYIDGRGDANEVRDVRFDDKYVCLVGVEGFHAAFIIGERVKRPAPKVLDADGVEIKVGDTVYEVGTGREFNVERLPNPHACQGVMLRHPNGGSTSLDAPRLTHARPDSWERLEEDAESIRQIIACNFGDFSPSDFKQSGDSLQDRVSGLVRRAKALAGAEVSE